MSLYKQPNSPYWWYSLTVDGKRHRASTGETVRKAALTVEAEARYSLLNGGTGLAPIARGATLRTLATRFLDWVERTSELEPNSRRYYRYGWRLLSHSPLADRRADTISPDEIACTTIRRPSRKDTNVLLPCSTTYTLQALRTLKVMFGKAEQWGVLTRRPRVPMPRPVGRSTLIDAHTDHALEKAFTSPVANKSTRQRRRQAFAVVACVQDAGMRPDEVFPMLIEHLDFAQRRIWVPSGKTPNAQRWVNMSDRMAGLLQEQCGDRKEGWVFPSKRAVCGHLTTISKGFQAARVRGKVAATVVPYSGRHTFGTYAMEQTKNVFAVSKMMGHGSIRSMEPYQHPNTDLPSVNHAINRRNKLRNAIIHQEAAMNESGHIPGHTKSTVN